MLAESVSQCFKVLNAVSDGGVFKRKYLKGKYIGTENMWTGGFYRRDILTEGRNFKTLLKENYAIGFDSMEWNMMF